MLTLNTEPDDGLVVTISPIRDAEADAPPIPPGELVRIAGVVVDAADNIVAWSVAWQGCCYWAMPEELRPARRNEMILAFSR